MSVFALVIFAVGIGYSFYVSYAPVVLYAWVASVGVGVLALSIWSAKSHSSFVFAMRWLAKHLERLLNNSRPKASSSTSQRLSATTNRGSSVAAPIQATGETLSISQNIYHNSATATPEGPRLGISPLA